MSFNPKLVEGRTIVRIDMNARREGNGPEARTMHSPVIYLDDGTALRFLVEEHPEGSEYGVDIIRTRKGE